MQELAKYDFVNVGEMWIGCIMLTLDAIRELPKKTKEFAGPSEPRLKSKSYCILALSANGDIWKNRLNRFIFRRTGHDPFFFPPRTFSSRLEKIAPCDVSEPRPITALVATDYHPVTALAATVSQEVRFCDASKVSPWQWSATAHADTTIKHNRSDLYDPENNILLFSSCRPQQQYGWYLPVGSWVCFQRRRCRWLTQ